MSSTGERQIDPKKSIESLTLRNVAIIAEMEKAASQSRTRGERLAEWVATMVGSWTFLIVQTVILLSWLTLNIVIWIKHWDPYPFILLNLALSFQSAYAAPILMISQNRQAEKDRVRADIEYEVNIKAELEVAHLHEKTDRIYENMMSRFEKLEKGMAP